MPYPTWMTNTLGTMGAATGPGQFPTLGTLGDSFGDRFGQWQAARSPAGLPATVPAFAVPDATPYSASAEGVGYVNPAGVAQGAITDPAELVRPRQGFDVGRFLASFDFQPARAVAQAQPFAFQKPVFGMTSIGRSRGNAR